MSSDDLVSLVRAEMAQSRRAVEAFFADERSARCIAEGATLIARSLLSGGKVLACGNGGSSADAMHLCEELTGRYRHDRRALAAIACVDPGHITCAANDFGYERVFSRWVEALGNPGDVLVGISTSGNSVNVIRAIELGKTRGLRTIALLGRGGGKLRGVCDVELLVPSPTGPDGREEAHFADRTQEAHMIAIHALIAAVERAVLG